MLERIRDKEHADVYTEMLESCEKDIAAHTVEIEALKNYDETVKGRKAKLKQSIDLLDDIINDGAISNAHLQMLIDEIIVCERDGQQWITIKIKAAFPCHIDLYDENGETREKLFECQVLHLT